MGFGFLLEDGSGSLLLESGSYLVLEEAPDAALLAEDSSYLTLEDASGHILADGIFGAGSGSVEDLTGSSGASGGGGSRSYAPRARAFAGSKDIPGLSDEVEAAWNKIHGIEDSIAAKEARLEKTASPKQEAAILASLKRQQAELEQAQQELERLLKEFDEMDDEEVLLLAA